MRVRQSIQKTLSKVLIAFVLLFGMTASAATSEADTTSHLSTISNGNPVYVNGIRVDPDNGVHVVELRRNTGITVNGVLYLSDREDPPERTQAKMEDGFVYYMVNRASWIAYDAYEDGKTFEQAREEVLAFWGQYNDRLKVTPLAESQYELTFEGESVFISIPRSGLIVDEPELSFFDRILVQKYKDLTKDLKKGRMVICGQTYYYCIHPGYVEAALSDLKELRASAEISGYMDGKPLYKGFPLADGTYVLCHSAVSDLIVDH